MSEASPALVLTGLTKVYRLYTRPGYKVLDLLGLCPPDLAHYSEHVALHPIDLTLNRGDKVAIIGRNGAGKSTLLKLITGAATPTAGRIERHGRISPLLQIGTGFHPDFTGRQNVFANLAHMGIVGREAARRFEEIVDFAELEQFIDQPMKTYSTGMGARLMFSTATAVEPEILVVDELLGVGDAYFAHKSFDRMRRLCTDKGATLLLVTHDLYSAMDLCDRFVWIDRGRVRHTGDGRTTVAAYEASIKEQEEARLRARNQGAAPATGANLRVVVRSRSGFALPAPLWLGSLGIDFEDGSRSELELADGDTAWHLTPESNLGEIETVEGRRARALQTFGRVFHKAEWTVAAAAASAVRVRASWLYSGNEDAEVSVLGDEDRPILKGALGAGEGWQQASFATADFHSRAGAGHYGTGAIRIVSVLFLDDSDLEATTFPHGGRLRMRVTLQRQRDDVSPEATFVVAFHRTGTTAAGYIHADRIPVAAAACVVNVDASPLVLGSGSWLVTCGVGEADLYQHQFNPYFTVNERWYHMIVRGYELHIESTSSIDASAFAVQPARITVPAAEVSRPGPA